MTHLTGWKATASALAVAVALQAVLVSAGIAPVGIILVVGLLFRTAVVAPARVTWPLALGSMAVLGTVEVLAARAQGQDHDLFVVVLLLALAAAAGLSLRYHRAFVGEAVARAEAAERGAEAEARRRVADDRLRIARDLHDSVAHRMAVVNMQASAAQKLLTRDPRRRPRCWTRCVRPCGQPSRRPPLWSVACARRLPRSPPDPSWTLATRWVT